MHRSVAILATIAVVFSLVPLLPFVPAQIALGSPQSYVCTGSADGTGINAVIAASSPGDTLTVSQGPGVSYCQIDVPIVIDKTLTLQGQGKDVTYLKGPGVENVAAEVAAAQAKAATAKAAAKTKLATATATLRARANTSGASGPATKQAKPGTGPGSGTGAGRNAGARANAQGGSGKGHAARAAAKQAHRANSQGNARSGGKNDPKATAQRIYNAFVSQWVGAPKSNARANALATVNTSTGPGIGVLDNLGTVTIQNFTITGFNNTGVDDAGGAIFVGIGTPVVIRNNAIRLNSASRGGGIALLEDNDGSQIANNTFENNVAMYTGSCCIPTSGSMAQEGGALWVLTDVDNLLISGNTFTSNSSNSSGGAIAIGWTNKNLTMSGNTCQSNVSINGQSEGGRGGCVKVSGNGPDFSNALGNNSSPTFTSNQFLNNNAAGSDAAGGAVSIGSGNGNTTFTGNTFQGNFGDYEGGALRIGDQGYHHTFTGNTFDSNFADDRAGAIHLGGINSTCGAPTTFTGNTFIHNSAVSAAGAMWIGATNSCLQFVGNTWTENAAEYGGGAISYGEYSPAPPTAETFGQPNAQVLMQNETFTGNSAGSGELGGGGAVHFDVGMPNLQILGGSFSGNASYYQGGAVSFLCSSCNSPDFASPRVTIDGASFTNNSSQSDGGAIFTSSSYVMDHFTIKNATFQGNSSTNSSGGAIEIEAQSPNMTIQNTSFIGNSSYDQGGAILFDALVNSLLVTGSTFRGNKATDDRGGAISFYDDTTINNAGTPAAITNSTFSGNNAYEDGGALSFAAPSDGFQVIGNTFSGNNADVDGGAIYWDATRTTTNALIKGNTFDGNKTDGSGGAVYFGGSSGSTGLEVRENRFTRNSAQGAGGAFQLGNGDILTTQDPNATIHHNWFESNSASNTGCCGDTIGAGGGLKVLGEVPGLRVYDNVLTRNTSLQGGGNFAALCSVCTGTSDMQVYNNTFTFGSAPTQGGGVLVQHKNADTVGTDGIADSIAFWNNVAYLNTAGDFAAEDTS
ncbi:MAG TPA: right-handed parallel beta-helix repeat-containing protein, partial [Chloroflexota bacterium]|nr:right-handed parallel beta-helix repeat-containing protein [Chloroflexota bacterium]